jgi:hypothetical protein
MKVWIPLTLIFTLGSAGYAQDTCTHPATPSTPPDGNSATKDDMIAGSKVVKAYAEEMDAYLKCVQGKIDGIPDADPKTLKGAEKTAAEQNKKEKEQLTKKYDAAVDEEKANAERFNVQLRIWKAKSKS